MTPGFVETATREEEQEALSRLLESGFFARAPSLISFLRYICTLYFAGRSAEIKEYSIAVEALGRPATFDKRRDSIVRVEAYRLRKRLGTYYEGLGRQDPVQLLLAEGSYVPRFRRSEPGLLHLEAPRPAALEPQGPLPLPLKARAGLEGPAISRGLRPAALRLSFSRRQWIGLALLLVAAPLVWYAFRVTPAATPAAGEAGALPAVSSASPAGDFRADGPEIRILAGRGQGSYTDRYGKIWEGDRYAHGGTAVQGKPIVAAGLDSNYFSALRAGTFEYAIPLPPGVFQLHLIFAESGLWGDGSEGESYRIFDVAANGNTILAGFDVVADAGGIGLPAVKVFRDISRSADGLLHLRFQPSGQGKAFVNAIELLPSHPGRMRPVRMVSRRDPHRDAAGNLWLPDHFVRTGVLIGRPVIPFSAPDSELYRGERYGKFSYTIPLPPGRYGLRLWFNEFWFGPAAPGGGGVGSRVFRVYANHKPLLFDFDLFREAGGSMRPVRKVFHGLQPNPQGKLVLDFEPVANYALVNALEVFDESRPDNPPSK